MANIKFGHGYVWKVKKGGKRENMDSLQDALTEQANCTACGCDNCLGHWTQINAETGELMAMWITGSDPYTLNIDTYDSAITTLKALKAARP